MEGKKVILFYNTPWGQPLDFPRDDIPEEFVLTTDRRFLDDAIAVVFHLPSLRPSPIISRRLGKRNGQLWVAWSMECESHYPYMDNPLFMNRFDLKMTYRLDSDVPCPYVEYGFKDLLRGAVRDKGTGNIVNSFISSRFNKSGRFEFLLKLMSVLDVHSYGKLLQNRVLENDSGRRSKMDTISKYKFTLAFENAVARDYVTEKFYDPLIAGSVPVYLGAPNIAEFAPGERCFIDTSEWESPESLARYLLEVSRSEEAYQSYFDWKQKPFSPNFTRLLELQKEHPFVRLCRKIEERL